MSQTIYSYYNETRIQRKATNTVWRAFVGVLTACLFAASTTQAYTPPPPNCPPGDPDCQYADNENEDATYTLDVGESEDDDSSSAIYIDINGSEGLSQRIFDGDPDDYRYVGPGGEISFQS